MKKRDRQWEILREKEKVKERETEREAKRETNKYIRRESSLSTLSIKLSWVKANNDNIKMHVSITETIIEVRTIEKSWDRPVAIQCSFLKIRGKEKRKNKR